MPRAALPDGWLAQGQLPPSPESQSCYQCHPGKSTQCLRGAMTDAVTCQNCHGGMKSVGGAFALRSGGSIDGRNDGKPRRPWVDLPRCQSCHTGDAVNHLALDPSLMATDGIRTLVAFQPDDPAASPILAANKRFAENTGKLYRFSKGHGGVACEVCHNSTHAIWPNPLDLHNDNVAAKQLQGHGDGKALRDLADKLRDRLGRGVVALGSEQGGKAILLVAVTKDLVGLVKAGDLVREAAKLVGGSGGGKPDLAQAGGPEPEGLDKALARVRELVATATA